MKSAPTKLQLMLYYIIKIGEKRRKNFPLERLLTVCMISPARPKPTKSNLNLSRYTLMIY